MARLVRYPLMGEAGRRSPVPKHAFAQGTGRDQGMPCATIALSQAVAMSCAAVTFG